LGWSDTDCKKRAHELMDDMGLPADKYAKRFPEELSGGQQQRIAVARALASNPDYLLMDEPFGALDAVTRDDLQHKVLDIRNQFKKTIIFVTHDIFESLVLGDRIAIIHDGSLQQIDKPREIIKSPATSFVEELVGKAVYQIRSFEKIVS
ncbi:MAG: ATP-binding cassette domain-containing protein, partial [Candidatus Lokiarchaeota archaeon]|nr:ATP-binding cassette domain-containing protein [Candidatus Lokiarchaeota archaeon]